MPAASRFVYILRSCSDPDRHYVGRTSDVLIRLGFHNAGLSPHTAKYRPWRIIVALEFPVEEQAVRFEKYLKSGSGRAFAKRHFGR
jgi:putative endonuclease